LATKMSKPKITINEGTITIPPPMPNNPDKIPAAIPRIKNPTKSINIELFLNLILLKKKRGKKAIAVNFFFAVQNYGIFLNF